MFEQLQRKFERESKARRREWVREQDGMVSAWLGRVEGQAESAGVQWPQPVELDLLRKLAGISGPFTAAQIGRNGWCGIRSTAAANDALERFVGHRWLYRLPPNRLGQSQYGFSREAALGTLPHEERPTWDAWDGMYDNLPNNQWTRRFNPLIAAGFIDGQDEDGDADESGEQVEIECGFCSVPDHAAEGDIWAVARKLAFEEGTVLHRITDRMRGLSPIQQAYALAIAQSRVMADPVPTHIRGIADYLGVDYNALRVAVKDAVEEITKLGGANGAATPTPTIEI